MNKGWIAASGTLRAAGSPTASCHPTALRGSVLLHREIPPVSPITTVCVRRSAAPQTPDRAMLLGRPT